jgi:hypothetical protein
MALIKKIASEPNPNAENVAPQKQEAKEEILPAAAPMRFEEGKDVYVQLRDWLLAVLGEQIWGNLRGIIAYERPYQEGEAVEALPEWLLDLLKTSLRHNEQISDAAHLAKILFAQWFAPQDENKFLKTELKQLAEALQNAQEKTENLQKSCDAAQLKAFQAEESLKETIPLRDFVEVAFSDKEGQRFLPLWEDALKNPAENLPDFALACSKAWLAFRQETTQLPENEEERLEILHKQLSAFLKGISGQHITQRRQVLDLVGKIASTYLQAHDFISPEESRQINLDLHAPVGNGELVREGISFAIIRRENRQVMRYAEVRT